ncbi:hypothetical protein B0A50_08207 [Salinomyces thailandicus]|uniref:Uncharacterized protein n=1 Tax=Salinomyces thailandicus TaxID=706561 RepID=A0A4U0TJX7_9PEZI|nr:hypothetical protein B0A50_08207 [Salinomyces thailandica]
MSSPNTTSPTTLPPTTRTTEETLAAFREMQDFGGTYLTDGSANEQELAPVVESSKGSAKKGKGKGKTAAATTTTAKKAVAVAAPAPPRTRRSARDSVVKKRRTDEVSEPETPPPPKKGKKGKEPATEATEAAEQQVDQAKVGPKAVSSSPTPAAASDDQAGPAPAPANDDNDKAVADAGGDEDDADGKKPAKSVIPTDYRGQTNNAGSATNKPVGALVTILDESWPCANRHCTTGMTWLRRDDGGKGETGYGRKSISQFFGRNKKQTSNIDTDVFHTYCRKCYQRASYQYTHQNDSNNEFYHKPAQGMAALHMINIRAQFTRLKLWRPDALFTVQLSKAMLTRSNIYHGFLREVDNDATIAQADYDVKYAPKPSKAKKKASKAMTDAGITTGKLPTAEVAFPVALCDSFKTACCGSGYDYDRIDQVLDYIQAMLDAGTITSVPPVEFLPNDVQVGETVNSAHDNYKRWLATVDGKTASPASNVAETGPSDTTAADDTNNEETTSDQQVEPGPSCAATVPATVPAITPSVAVPPLPLYVPPPPITAATRAQAAPAPATAPRQLGLIEQMLRQNPKYARRQAGEYDDSDDEDSDDEDDEGSETEGEETEV